MFTFNIAGEDTMQFFVYDQVDSTLIGNAVYNLNHVYAGLVTKHVQEIKVKDGGKWISRGYVNIDFAWKGPAL